MRDKVSPENLELIGDKLKGKTTPSDNRFPTQNQMNHCWNRYNEWVLCLKESEGDSEGCAKKRQLAVSICPNVWLEKWDEGRDTGAFPGVKFEG